MVGNTLLDEMHHPLLDLSQKLRETMPVLHWEVAFLRSRISDVEFRGILADLLHAHAECTSLIFNESYAWIPNWYERVDAAAEDNAVGIVFR